MKAVLMSIQPKWCELIASGKKTVEVRKRRPNLDTPFKVYIYCTKPRHYYKISKHLLTSDESLFLINGKVRICDGFGVEYEDSEYKHLNCKVIGEFVCDEIIVAEDGSYCKIPLKAAQLDVLDLLEYADDKTVYGWHISNLIIYDKPKELSEFDRECKGGCDIPYLYYPPCDKCRKNKLPRPPQSWCYVEEMR